MSDQVYIALRSTRMRIQAGLTAADAAIIGPELQRLDDTGAATPPAIVDAARPDEAVLHPYFEWDNDRAAEAYREHQAETIVRTVRVVRRHALGSVTAGPAVTTGERHRIIRRENNPRLAAQVVAVGMEMLAGNPAMTTAERTVRVVERAEEAEYVPPARREPTPIGRPQAALTPREELVAAVLELSEWARRWSSRPHIRQSLKPIYSIIAAAESRLGLTRDDQAV